MKHGEVFKGDDGNLYLVRCPKCGRENYAVAVANGQCCWCGYEATEDDCQPKGTWAIGYNPEDGKVIFKTGQVTKGNAE